MSAGEKFRQALETERPLQVAGTINAYTACWLKKQASKRSTCQALAWPTRLSACRTWQ